jgi:nucleotide-binding universal stress UspA family protein
MKTAMQEKTSTVNRIQFSNILVATDFSPASGAALHYAADLATLYGARLFIFHAIAPVINPMTPPQGWAELEKAAREYQRERREEIAKALPGMEPVVMIQEGDVWAHLETMIPEKKIDLVVVGTHGRSAAGRFILGSQAERIFRQAPCPVLTVGPHAEGRAKEHSIGHILFATGLGPEGAAAVPYALSLAEEYQACLTLLHVIEPPRAGEVASPHVFVESSTRALKALVPPEAEAWCVPDFAVEQGNVAEKILEVARGRSADLIVLGVRHPGNFLNASTHWPSTIAYRVAAHAACPVLTVPNLT